MICGIVALTNTGLIHRQYKYSKKGGKDQESIQVPHLTQGTTWESDKNTIRYHKQEARPFPEGDFKTAMNQGKT